MPADNFNNLRLNFDFSFDEQWEIAPASSPGVGTRTPSRIFMPPGGGLTPRTISIGPIHLQGLSSDEVAKIVRQRAEDMATLSEAIAIANIQFREALEGLPSTPAATHQTAHTRKG